ncbi:hypothetical protein TNCV_2884941 [Trichonephila clavipes]|nr:hypothetical protein TNCV_2884941 [Trichonephila clavipes]
MKMELLKAPEKTESEITDFRFDFGIAKSTSSTIIEIKPGCVGSDALLEGVNSLSTVDFDYKIGKQGK